MIRESLDLVGDEDLELVLEDVFDVRFSDDELMSMHTVGAIHDVLHARFPDRTGACETSMVFYRLRRGFLAMDAPGRIGPRSDLPRDFQERPKAMLLQLSKLTGLRLPYADGGPLAAAGWAAAAMAAIAGAVGAVTDVRAALWIAGAAAIVAVALGALDRGRLPKGVQTAGDLSRLAVPLNYGALIHAGARSDAAGLWAVLTETIADVLDIRPEEIGRETRIYPAEKAAA